MAWIIMKSAGNKHSFTSWYVDDPRVGHKYEYANDLARKVTIAMKELPKKEMLIKDILEFIDEEFYEITKGERKDLESFLRERLYGYD